jgi:hypothetical protein
VAAKAKAGGEENGCQRNENIINVSSMAWRSA